MVSRLGRLERSRSLGRLGKGEPPSLFLGDESSEEPRLEGRLIELWLDCYLYFRLRLSF